MPSQLVMNASPGCGLLTYVKEPRIEPKIQKKVRIAGGEEITEELRVEKKLKAMLEKKLSTVNAALEQEKVRRKGAEDRSTILEKELGGAKETIMAFGDVHSTLQSLRQDLEGSRLEKDRAESQISEVRHENRELEARLDEALRKEGELQKRMKKAEEGWMAQIDALALQEAMAERDKESLAQELEKTKVEHNTVLKDAQRLLLKYETEMGEKIDLEEELIIVRDRKEEATQKWEDACGVEAKKREKAEEENARLKEKIKRLEADAVEHKAQIQSLNTRVESLKHNQVASTATSGGGRAGAALPPNKQVASASNYKGAQNTRSGGCVVYNRGEREIRVLDEAQGKGAGRRANVGEKDKGGDENGGTRCITTSSSSSNSIEKTEKTTTTITKPPVRSASLGAHMGGSRRSGTTEDACGEKKDGTIGRIPGKTETRMVSSAVKIGEENNNDNNNEHSSKISGAMGKGNAAFTTGIRKPPFMVGHQRRVDFKNPGPQQDNKKLVEEDGKTRVNMDPSKGAPPPPQQGKGGKKGSLLLFCDDDDDEEEKEKVMALGKRLKKPLTMEEKLDRDMRAAMDGE